MLKPRKEMLKYVNDTCVFPSNLTWQDMETILFECNEWDMDFYVEELVWSAGDWDGSLNISYYDDNAWCICLVWNVDYEWRYNTAEEVVDTILWWQDRVNSFKEKFLKLKEE